MSDANCQQTTAALQQQLAQINQLLEQSTAAIACGPTCQKEKKTEDLKQIYINAEANIQNGPSLLEEAKKNYYIYSQGAPAYDRMRENELKVNASKIGDELTNVFNDIVSSATTLNQYYNSELINSKHTEDLLAKYDKDNSLQKRRLGNKYSDVLTNDRKTYYEQNATDNLKQWYNFWWYIYYILVAVFLLAIFLSNSTMTRLTILIISVLLIFYPYYIHPIVLYIIKTYKSVNSLMPKNIYNNL